MGRKEVTELNGVGTLVLELVLAPLVFVMVILLYAITLLAFFSPLPCFAPKSDETRSQQ